MVEYIVVEWHNEDAKMKYHRFYYAKDALVFVSENMNGKKYLVYEAECIVDHT